MKKNKLSKKDVLALADLAKLHLTEKEIEDLRDKLIETINYIDNLHQLNTKNIPPTNHAVNSSNVFFEDGEKNQRQLTNSEALMNAKNKKNSYFVVKKILS